MALRTGGSLAALFVGLVPAAWAGTLTVGPAGSGAQFTEIQAAVDAAQPGDVIRVLPGTYARIVVDKAVRILGAGAGRVTVAGVGFAAELRDVAAGAELVLSGLTLHALGTGTSVVSVEDSPGTIVLHDLALPLAFDDRPGIRIEDCGRVLLLDSVVRGGTLGGFGATQEGAVRVARSELWVAGSEVLGAGGDHNVTQEGAHGIELESSRLRLWSTRVAAGGSGTTLMGSSGKGGTGILATASSLDLFGGPGSEILGGHGAFESTTSLNYPGGPGVSLRQGSALFTTLHQPVEGGLDGLEQVRTASFVHDGTTRTQTDTLRFPTLASPARAALGSIAPLVLEGNAGALHVVYLAQRTGPTTTLRHVLGAGVLDTANQFIPGLLVLPNTGQAAFGLRVPPIASLLDETFFLQSAEMHGNRYSIGNPALVTIQ